MLRQFWCVMSLVVKPSVARRTSSQILLKLAGHKGGGGMDSESMQCAHSVASIGCSWSVLPGMKYNNQYFNCRRPDLPYNEGAL